jgi:hypothetical protein
MTSRLKKLIESLTEVEVDRWEYVSDIKKLSDINTTAFLAVEDDNSVHIQIGSEYFDVSFVKDKLISLVKVNKLGKVSAEEVYGSNEGIKVVYAIPSELIRVFVPLASELGEFDIGLGIYDREKEKVVDITDALPSNLFNELDKIVTDYILSHED